MLIGLFMLLILVAAVIVVIYRTTLKPKEALEEKCVYSIEAVKEATKIGLQSESYREIIIDILEKRLMNALKKDDAEAAYALAAGIVALEGSRN